MNLSAVFIAKPETQQLEDLFFNQDILNDIIAKQWLYSVLEKANSKKIELMRNLFEKFKCKVVFIQIVLDFGL